ncbi:MAG: hypothetical protein OIF56_11160 [Cohaesibacter sp.]|nr:hypothetical protein [Cohaesibacter sp.]MCV6602029.1 hypothetical protein [Cohaesibacter sp.]
MAMKYSPSPCHGKAPSPSFGSFSSESLLFAGKPLSMLRSLLIAGTLTAGLAGCSGGAGGLSVPSLGGLGAGSKTIHPVEPAPTSSASDIAKTGVITDEATRLMLSNPKKLTGYCPSVSVLGDTTYYQSFERNHDGDQRYLIYQGVITQTARECTNLGAEMYIKVGIAGRVLAGPKGETAKALLPIRVVIREVGGDVLYSKLHKVSAQITPPDRSALFAQIDDAIPIPTPDKRNLKILVGFDSGAK